MGDNERLLGAILDRTITDVMRVPGFGELQKRFIKPEQGKRSTLPKAEELRIDLER